MGVKLGNGNWAVKEDKLLAYNDKSGKFFNKEFDFTRGSSATYVAKDGLIKTAGIQPNSVLNGDFSQEGAELVTNGGFDTDSDWIKGGNVNISNGKANWVNAANNVGLNQSGVITDSKHYKVTFTVSNYTSGSFRIRFPFTSDRVQANGTYTFYGVASGTDFYLQGETLTDPDPLALPYTRSIESSRHQLANGVHEPQIH